MTIKKTTRPSRSAKKKKAAPSTDDTNAVRSTADPNELRRRWENVRRIIRDAVGQNDEHNPQLWERGVYQLWLWLVVERLVVRGDEIDLDELSIISKMLHDQRKLSLEETKHQQKATENNGNGNGTIKSTRLPEHFGELVRQIYGTNFQNDQAVTTEQ